MIITFLAALPAIGARATYGARTTSQLASHSIDGVVSFGRHGLGVPDNVHHVVRMADHLVNSVSSDGKLDSSRWDEALRSFTKHVVED